MCVLLSVHNIKVVWHEKWLGWESHWSIGLLGSAIINRRY